MTHLRDNPVANAAMHASHRALVRTSLTDPLRIDELVVGDADGRIGLCLCPGKRAGSLTGPRWERDLAADLEVVRGWRASAVLTLIEDHEFEELGVTQLGAQVRARGIEWHHLPIADYHPPDGRFEAAWSQRGPELLSRLHAGGRVLVHCRGGLGRAGTVAARMLVELQVPPHDAIERVRRARPGAIETRAQRDHVINLARRNLHSA